MKMIHNLITKAFMEDERKPEGIDAVEAKCNEVIQKSEVGSAEFQAAYAQLEKVKALRMTEMKVKRMPKVDPAIVGAGLGVVGQIVCTGMIEKYNADGHLFPMPGKSVTTGWLGLNGLWTKISGVFTNRKQ